MPLPSRLGLATLLAALAACSPHVEGNGIYAQRVFDAGAVPAFQRVAVDLPRDGNGQPVIASIHAGDGARQVVVSGDQNVVEHVRPQVDAGQLRAVIDVSYTVVHPLQLWVQAPGLVAVDALAGAQVTVVEAGAPSFSVTVQGQAEVALSGGGGDLLTVDASEGGQLDAASYPAGAAQVTLSGGASAKLWSGAPVSGSATGTGTVVKVKGDVGCAPAPEMTLSGGATCGPL
jgi:hypothetical protein